MPRLLQLYGLIEECFEFTTRLPRLDFKFEKELSFLVSNLAPSEQYSPQPEDLRTVNPAVSQDVILESVIEKLLEPWVWLLHPFVQLNHKVSFLPVNFATCIQLTVEHLQVVAIDLSP